MGMIIGAFALVMVVVIGMIFAATRLQKHGDSGNKWITVLLLVGVVFVIFILPALMFSNIMTAWQVFDHVTKTLTLNTAMSKWLILIAGVIVTPIVLIGISLAFSFKRQRRYSGYAVLGAISCLWFLCMYFVTADSIIDREGKCLKVVARTPEGWKVYDAPEDSTKTVYEVIYGIPMHCPDAAERAELRQLEIFEKTSKPPADAFFNMDGTPRKWYYRNDLGGLVVVDHPGTDYLIGVQLTPITATIVRELRKQTEVDSITVQQKRDSLKATEAQRLAERKRQDFQDKYVSRGFSGFSSNTDICLLHTFSADEILGNNVSVVAADLSSFLSRRGYRVVSHPFTESFDQERFPDHILLNNTKVLHELGLDEARGAICVFGLESDGESSAGIGALRSTKVRLILRVIGFDGRPLFDTLLVAQGIGKDATKVQEQVLSHLRSKISRL